MSLSPDLGWIFKMKAARMYSQYDVNDEFYKCKLDKQFQLSEFGPLTFEIYMNDKIAYDTLYSTDYQVKLDFLIRKNSMR